MHRTKWPEKRRQLTSHTDWSANSLPPVRWIVPDRQGSAHRGAKLDNQGSFADFARRVQRRPASRGLPEPSGVDWDAVDKPGVVQFAGIAKGEAVFLPA